MSVTRTASPARSDLSTATTTHDTWGAPSTTQRPFRRHGQLLAAGAASWAAAIAVIGLDPDPQGRLLPLLVFGVTSGTFQLGLLALLRVFRRTQALGRGRIARAVLTVQTVLLTLAICSTMADAIALSDLSQPGWLALDAFWPLSMLGMFLIGIRVAVAGRLQGAVRWWPLVAESWAPVAIPAVVLLGSPLGEIVAGGHLLIGYTVLGLLVARERH